MLIYDILLILVAHFIFDFVLQTDEMAKNKSKSLTHLYHHTGVYSIGLLCCLVLFSVGSWGNFLWVIPWLAVNVGAHLLQDSITSKCSGAIFEKEGPSHNFFVVIGFDQLLHYITLFGTYIYFSNL